jgi:hypothetical protein
VGRIETHESDPFPNDNGNLKSMKIRLLKGLNMILVGSMARWVILNQFWLPNFIKRNYLQPAYLVLNILL